MAFFPLQSTVTSLIASCPRTTLGGWCSGHDYPRSPEEEMETRNTGPPAQDGEERWRQGQGEDLAGVPCLRRAGKGHTPSVRRALIIPMTTICQAPTASRARGQAGGSVCARVHSSQPLHSPRRQAGISLTHPRGGWPHGEMPRLLRQGCFGTPIPANPMATLLSPPSPVLPPRRERDPQRVSSRNSLEGPGLDWFPILTGLNETFIFMTIALTAGWMSGYLFRS